MIAFAAPVLAAEESAHLVHELPFPATVFGVIIFVIFTALAIFTFSFRDVANRHAEKAAAYAREHGAADSTHGAPAGGPHGEDGAQR